MPKKLPVTPQAKEASFAAMVHASWSYTLRGPVQVGTRWVLEEGQEEMRSTWRIGRHFS